MQWNTAQQRGARCIFKLGFALALFAPQTCLPPHKCGSRARRNRLPMNSRFRAIRSCREPLRAAQVLPGVCKRLRRLPPRRRSLRPAPPLRKLSPMALRRMSLPTKIKPRPRPRRLPVCLPKLSTIRLRSRLRASMPPVLAVCSQVKLPRKNSRKNGAWEKSRPALAANACCNSPSRNSSTLKLR